MGDEEAPPLRRVMDEIAEVRRRLDSVERDVILFARSRGATWEEIGGMLGISRQAARQRFGQVRRRQR